MRRIVHCFVALLLFTAQDVFAAGRAIGTNYIVYADSQELATKILSQSQRFRKELAITWLGREIPDGACRAIITQGVSPSRREGRTSLIGDSQRSHHLIWLTLGEDGRFEDLLASEIARTVLAWHDHDGLPPWIYEVAASRHDDAQRTSERRATLRWFSRTGNWPGLHRTFDQEVFFSLERAGYNMAASVGSYLLSRGGHRTLLAFAAAGCANGWDSALQRHYDIKSTAELQTRWQRWVEKKTVSASQSHPPDGT